MGSANKIIVGIFGPVMLTWALGVVCCLLASYTSGSTVTCAFTAYNNVVSMFVDMEDVSANIFGDRDLYSAIKTVSFEEKSNGGGYAAQFVALHIDSGTGGTSDDRGSLMFACRSSDDASPWNNASSSTAWRAYSDDSSSNAPTDWNDPYLTDGSWDRATSGLTLSCEDCESLDSSVEGIWPTGGNRYAWFRFYVNGTSHILHPYFHVFFSV